MKTEDQKKMERKVKKWIKRVGASSNRNTKEAKHWGAPRSNKNTDSFLEHDLSVGNEGTE